MAENTTPPPAAPAPTKWWQYAFLYPTLLLSLGSSLPLLWREVVAWHKGVESSRLQLVEEQEKLWQRNLGCAGTAGTWELDLPQGVTAKVTPCPSGDILIRYFFQERDVPPAYQWVRAPEERAPRGRSR